MSGRSSARQRSKSARAQAAEAAAAEEDEANEMLATRKRRKRNITLKDRSETPNSRNGSRLSTPASSRGGSRSPTPTPKVGRPKSMPVSRINKKPGRRVGSGSGTNSRQASTSRSSSVTSNTKIAQPSRGRPSLTVPPIKLKIKAKVGRGYNSALVNYEKESEYHYGSDFEDDDGDDSDAQSSKTEDSSEEESESANEEEDLVDSDVEFDAEAAIRPSTPIPFWLRTDEDVPEIHLPPSSEDLLIPDEYLLKACSVYEVLRHYSILLRLSPFRFEDFCAAVSSEDQSNLLSEIHIALFKSIVRAEEKDGVQFGPLDYKDSIQSILYFMDSLTWSESLKLYLSSDPVAYAGPLEIFEKNKEYPLAPTDSCTKEGSIENRICMLSFLTDQFLTTTAVRDDIVNEGRQAPEDHCRICHRLGDMIVCEQCSGIYHFTCLDPPLDDVPEDDWQCYVCQANQVSGVTDIVSKKERLGEMHRHESLGIDRAGNKYWFLCRRLIIEKKDGDGIVAYYTTLKQFEEMLDAIDTKEYEHDLTEAIENIRDEITENMKLTESLTADKKPSNRQSYIELENASIEKMQKEREESARQEVEDKVRLEEDKERLVKVEIDKKREEEEAVLAEVDEKRKKQRGERLKKREEKRGDSWISGDDEMSINDSDLKTEIKEEDCKEDKIFDKPMSSTVSSSMTTTMTTNILDQIKGELKSEVKDETDTKCSDKKPGDSLLTSINHKPTTRAQTGSLPNPKLLENETLNELRLNERLTRSTVHHIASGTLYFKLGQEQSFKSYINQYSTNSSALSKVQSNDERVKRTHMSHKFSLTDAAAFKWIGTLHGNRNQLVTTLRQTMIQLEKELPSTFMHPNWTLLRKPWIGAVSQSVTPRDFARALTVIKCCIKPCVLLSQWKDSLGHTQFKKVTAQMRDDKKKSERRERKEREDEDEKLRPWMTFVKYTLGLKHQVSKQKGEEYRAHGQNGWLWLSSSRNYSPSDSRKLGLRNGAYRLAVKYTDIRDSSFKIVLMEPKAFKYLLGKQKDIENKKESQENGKAENDAENQPPKENVNAPKLGSKFTKESEPEDEKPTIERKKLEQALKNAKLEWQVTDDDMFNDVIDIQAALSNPTRIMYPKVAKTTKVLDHFLSRRLQLKQLEERRIELKTGVKSSDVEQNTVHQKIEKSKSEDGIVDVEGESDTKTAITSHLAPNKLNEKDTNSIAKSFKATLSPSQMFYIQAKADIEKLIAKLKDEGTDHAYNRKSWSLKCYSAVCVKQSNSCYSITCPNYNPISQCLNEAKNECKRIREEAKIIGVNIPETVENIKTKADAIEHLKEMLNTVSTGNADHSDETSSLLSNITVSTSTTTTSETTTKVTTLVNGEIESIQTSKSKTSIESKSDSNQVSDNLCTSTLTTKDTKARTSTIEETVSKDGDVTRIYSSKDTTGRLYLKRIQSVADMKRQGKVVRYPLAPNFYSKARKKRNILLLAKHDVKHMARKFGISYGEGFNYNAKSNNQVWPYPCPRPFFHTTWSYRTSSSEAIQSVGLQLKILWACIRWDDMNSKTPSADGKHQVTTDNAITTTEILKHRNTGRFLENTQYFQRKVTIPLNVPTRPRPSSPIRSGLRKRKRAESPTQSEPQLTEQWIDEKDLELWEIRAYKERLEREKYVSITRGRSDTIIKGPDRFDPSSYSSSNRRRTDMTYDKEELEKGYRKDPSWEPDEEQSAGRRENSIPRRFNKVYDPTSNSPSSNIITMPLRSSVGVSSNNTPTIIRRITNADGSISVVRTAGVRPIAPTLATNINSAGVSSILTPPAKKVFISKDGKVIGTQLIQQTPNGPRIITPSSIRPGVGQTQIMQQNASPSNASGLQQTPTVTSSPQQKVQIVRSADGKIQVRGLLPGQQLVQMPDGRLQIFSSPSSATTVVSTTNSTTVATPGPSRVVLQSPQQSTTPGLNSSFSPATVGPKIIPSGSTTSTNTPNQVIAQQLPPGAQIPPGMTAFVSGGKTYVIPKTTPSITQQPSTVSLTSTPNSFTTSSPTISGSISSNSIANKAVILPSSASTVIAAPQTATPKQMVEVKALGPNVVQFKGNQMIVSGPDVQQAQLIAKQLSSGAARLATLGGKQVLISTSAMVNTIPSSTPTKTGNEEANLNPSTSNATSAIKISSPTVLQTNINKPAVTQGIKVMNDIKSVSCSTTASVQEGIVKSTNSTSISTHHPVKEIHEGNAETALVAGESTQATSNQSTNHATAQLLQTPQGPRIILQGIQAANIPKEQLLSIQQQVKNQLLKAQAEAKKDNKVPPTKISIQLPPSIQSKLQQEPSQINKTEIKDPSKSLAISTSNQIISQPQNVTINQQPNQHTKLISAVDRDGDTTQYPGSKPIMLQKQLASTGIPGQKVIVMNQQKVGYATPIASLTSPIKPQPNTSLLLSSLQNSKPNRIIISNSATSTIASQNNQVVKVLGTSNSMSNTVSPHSQIQSKHPVRTKNEDINHILGIDVNVSIPSAAVDGKGDKFELTPGYIQKTISDALKTENLSPEIEQKLLALQEHTDKSQSKPLSRKERKNAIDPETGEQMDDEWDPYGTKTRYIRKRMEKEKTIPNADSETFNPTTYETSSEISNTEAVANFSSNDIENHPKQALMTSNKNTLQKTNATLPSSILSAQSEITRSSNKSSTIILNNSDSNIETNTSKTSAENFDNEKRKEELQHKLHQMLDRHKELLKRDIAKKRAFQEKELQQQIKHQIETLKSTQSAKSVDSTAILVKQLEKSKGPSQPDLGSSNCIPISPVDTHGKDEKSHTTQSSPQLHSANDIQNNYIDDEEYNRKRKRSKSGDSPLSAQIEFPSRKKRKSISNNIPSRKDKRHCICRTKYDPSKFYVGCDVCNEWFHGDCVGITEEHSKDISEFVCDGCSKASDNQDIYCLCQQPYDNTQAYIGCDGCPDWFHGRCVGILDKETQKINQYFCPRCSPNSELNLPNSKALHEKDYDLVRKVVKQLLGNRYAAPFKEPVNPSDVPNYYKVVKVPMDLQTIDQRVGQKYYKTLGEFIGDVMRIFENCRFFNPENSPITKSADSLENYFIQKLTLLREKVAGSEI